MFISVSTNWEEVFQSQSAQKTSIGRFFWRNLHISYSTVDDKVEARHQIQDGEVAASEKEQFEGTKIKSQLLIPRITKCNYIYLLLSKQGQKLK